MQTPSPSTDPYAAAWRVLARDAVRPLVQRYADALGTAGLRVEVTGAAKLIALRVTLGETEVHTITFVWQADSVLVHAEPGGTTAHPVLALRTEPLERHLRTFSRGVLAKRGGRPAAPL